MWHDVPNRGGAITIVAAERNLGGHRPLVVHGRPTMQARGGGGTATAMPTNHVQAVNGDTGLRCRWRRTPTARLSPERFWENHQSQRRCVAATQRDGQPDSLPAGHPGHYAGHAHHTHPWRRIPVSSHRVGHCERGCVDLAHCDANNPFPGTPQDLGRDSSAGVASGGTSASGAASIRDLVPTSSSIRRRVLMC